MRTILDYGNTKETKFRYLSLPVVSLIVAVLVFLTGLIRYFFGSPPYQDLGYEERWRFLTQGSMVCCGSAAIMLIAVLYLAMDRQRRGWWFVLGAGVINTVNGCAIALHWIGNHLMQGFSPG